MPPAVSSSMTMKRIHREIADVAREDLGPITLAPTDSLFVWKGSIPGPAGSPYESGIFGVDVTLATDYPFSAPKVTFSTRIYHMNVSERGQICMDILKNNWSPALSLFKVMLSLSSLLTDPNPQDPLVPSIATEFVRNRAQHDKTARQWAELYAKPPSQPPVPKAISAPKSALASSSSNAPATITTTPAMPSKNKGKEKAAPPPPAPHAKQSRNGNGNGTIIIDSDSDTGSEVPKAPAKGKKRKLVDGDVVDLTGDIGDLNEETGGGRKGKRRALGGGSTSVGGAGAGAGEVIVIDD